MFLVLACVALTSACVTQQARYAWGSYEDLMYVAYIKPGTLTLEAQVEKLEADRVAARAANKPLPPGWHAHLGYVYFQMGRADLARDELTAEKSTFPESGTFVDRLLANMAGPATKSP